MTTKVKRIIGRVGVALFVLGAFMWGPLAAHVSFFLALIYAIIMIVVISAVSFVFIKLIDWATE